MSHSSSIYHYLLHAGAGPTSAANILAVLLLSIDGTDRRADGRTDTRPFDDAYSHTTRTA